MSKIAKRLNIKIEKCEDCPYYRMIYIKAHGGRWEDKTAFLCKKIHVHMQGNKESIPQDCPLEDEKEFEVSMTSNELKVIELLRVGLNERAEPDCDYECYYGTAGCPEEIVKHHYRCDGCRAREILKEIKILENKGK